jgi:hypothetical protein
MTTTIAMQYIPISIMTVPKNSAKNGGTGKGTSMHDMGGDVQQLLYVYSDVNVCIPATMNNSPAMIEKYELLYCEDMNRNITASEI